MKKVFLLCAVVGFFLMIGTAGASDLNVISFGATVLLSFIALVLALGGFIGYKVLDNK